MNMLLEPLAFISLSLSVPPSQALLVRILPSVTFILVEGFGAAERGLIPCVLARLVPHNKPGIYCRRTTGSCVCWPAEC